MSRVIKFRAWDSAKNRMGTPWNLEDEMKLPAPIDGHYLDRFPNHVVFMQFTGLLDKNGKEIYEGDIFGKFGGDKDRPGEYEFHGRVTWDDDFAMFVMVLHNGGWMELFDYFKDKSSEKEIIGNIYENADLIK